jgi:hypothetical protein
VAVAGKAARSARPARPTATLGETGDGSSLVDAACSVSCGPRVAFNSLTTEWERSERTGIATLLKSRSLHDALAA